MRKSRGSTTATFQTRRKPSGDMRARLEEAEERRKAQSEAKLKVVRETTGLERHNRMRSASATRREAHYSATLEKRQQQLQESGQQKKILILNTVTKIKFATPDTLRMQTFAVQGAKLTIPNRLKNVLITQ